jgi:hypothetical protein
MRDMSKSSRDPSLLQGRRAEEVANWYFRLNGFLQIPGFILHSDVPRQQITDADVLGVRFPYSCEMLNGVRMIDDRWLSQVTLPNQVLFVIGEVKVSTCKINGPWTDPTRGGMEKVIRRIGFASDAMTRAIADSLYQQLFWQNDDYAVQYVAIGTTSNHELTHRFRKLKQLLWPDIAAFLFERFNGFGPIKGVPPQWPLFGRAFARAFERKYIEHLQQAHSFIQQYIELGDSALRVN